VLPALPATAATLIVYRVPLIDRIGSVIEQRVAVLRVPESWAMIRRDPRRLRVLSGIAASTVMSRARRVSRFVSGLATYDIEVERALAAASIESCSHVRPQPGLFDRRFDREMARASSQAEAIDAQRRHRIAQHEARRLIDVGRPLLVMAIECRS
jgi:hypothetical protein